MKAGRGKLLHDRETQLRLTKVMIDKLPPGNPTRVQYEKAALRLQGLISAQKGGK